MRKIIVSSMLVLCVVCNAQEFLHPAVVYSTAPYVKINSVTLTNDVASVKFSYMGEPYSAIHLSPSIVAVDETGKKYPIISTEGIELGSPLRLTDTRSAEFTLHFMPLPTGTKTFDIIEGRGRDDVRIYGIHDADTPLSISHAPEEVLGSAIDEICFSPGNAVLRGRVECDAPQFSPKELTIHYLQRKMAVDNAPVSSRTIDIAPDGTFCTTLDLCCTIWDSFNIGASMYYFFLHPGDTLDVEIRHFRQWNEEVDYRSSLGRDCHATLMNECKLFYDDACQNKLFRAEYQEHLEKKSRQVEKLHDYLIKKYHFTPWEAHLLKTQQRLQFAFLQAFYMDAWSCRQNETHSPVALPDGSLSQFDRIAWQDSTIAITSTWNNMPLAHYIVLWGINLPGINPLLQHKIEEQRTKTTPRR